MLETHVARDRQRSVSGPDEFHFTDAQELCVFLQAEIFNSHMTYKSIAEKAHVCQSTVSNLGKGATRFPRLATVVEILRVLGFEVVVR